MQPDLQSGQDADFIRLWTVSHFVAFQLGMGLLLSPESVLTALLAALSVFGVLWGLRTLAYRRDGGAQCGLGDVYLMAGLGMWFSFPAVLWVISGAAVSGGLFLLARRSRHPMQWQENVNYRSAPFAPFLCGVAAIAQVGQMGSYV